MRLIVEADGGSRGNPGPAAYGALVRDADTGAVLAEAAQTLGTATNNVAEYRGLIAGLELAVEIDPTADVEVRMDSKLVVEQMAGRWKIKHVDLKPLAQQAVRTFPHGVATWTWVPRGQNARADALVNDALDGKLARTEPADAGRSDVSDVSDVSGAPGAGSASAALAPEPRAPLNRESSDPPATAPSGEQSGDPGAGRRSPGSGRGTTLLFLRHGRTADNTARRFSGRRGEDPGLDEVGRHQSAVVAAALAGAGISAVVSSPLRRARETAEVVAAPLGLGVSVDAAFADFDPGGWDGATSDQVRSDTPAWHAAWSVSPDVAPPDGESVRAVQVRVSTGVVRLLQRYPDRRVLVVAHAVPIGCALVSALEAPLSSALRLSIANGSLSVIRYPPDGPPRTEVVALPAGTVLPE